MGNAMGFRQYFTFNGLSLSGGTVLADVKMTQGQEAIDVTTIGSNWKGFEQGQANAAITVSGVWEDGTAVTALDKVLQANLNAGGTKLWEFAPSGSAANKPLYRGNGFLTAYEVGGAVGGRVGFSASIQVSGSVTQGVCT